MTETARHRPTLVPGGTGKTGCRLVERLARRNVPVRIGSRSAGLPFGWEQPSTWRPVFQDTEAARVLGRPARDFADYARVTAATGVWNPMDQSNPGSLR